MINKTDKALSSSDSETIQLQNEAPKTKVKRQYLPDNKSENGINDLLSQLPPRLAKRVIDYAIENETTVVLISGIN